MMVRYVIAALGCIGLCLTAFSAITIPKESKVLGVTKGRSIATGLVFINGKVIEPPYLVERWGNGIRINSQPVVPQVVEWTEFLKTQTGVKVTKSESMPVAPAEAPAVAAVTATPVVEDNDDSLDDLFDDEPKAKKTVAPKPKKAAVKIAPPKPVVTVSYALEGEFEKNDAVKALVKRVNDVRAEIDYQLRQGSFIYFGERYSRVSGDSRTAKQMLEKMPRIMREAKDASDFIAAVRAANMVYLTEGICQDVFRNRVDYLKLQKILQKWEKDGEWKKILDQSAGTSLY